MADVMKKIKNTMNRGIATVSVKTSSSIEKSKIKVNIESLEKELTKLLINIAEDAYGAWENEITDFSFLSSDFEEIKSKKEEIKNLENELASIDARDNQILGSTAADEKKIPVSEKKVCPKCSTAYESAVKFCRNCGQDLREI